MRDQGQTNWVRAAGNGSESNWGGLALRQHILTSIAVVLLLGSPQVVKAADAVPIEGTLTVLGRDYKLSHAVAYETKSDDFELVTILASNRALPIGEIQAALRKDKNDESISLSQPYVKVVFSKAGEVQHCNAWADNGSFSTGGSHVTGELAVKDNRAIGKTDSPLQGEDKSKRGFSFRFNLPLGAEASPSTKPKPTGPVKPALSGKFLGNGKPAKLAYVSAHVREPFNDKPSVQLIFTEKDHSQEKKPEIMAGFGKFGSALLISVAEDGSIFGCEVAHAAHGKGAFSSLGSIRMEEFEIGDNYIQGQITTDGEQDAFGKKWDVDLKFAAPLAGRVAPPTSTAKAPEKSPAKKPKVEPAEDPQPAAEALNVRALPLPKDVTNLEYKQIVEQLVFKSPAKVQALAADLAKQLAAQGWKNEAADLITPNSAILNRVRGAATLTIMVKPAANGSQATIFTTGLNWDEKP